MLRDSMSGFINKTFASVLGIAAFLALVGLAAFLVSHCNFFTW